MESNKAVTVLEELLEADSLKTLGTLTDEQIEAIRMARDALKNHDFSGERHLNAPYIFGMTLCHRRTGAHIGKAYGAVFADSLDDAENIAWEKFGGDLCCEL